MPGDVLLLQQCDCVVNGENRAGSVLLRGRDGECVVAEPLSFHETDYLLRIGGEDGSAALAQDNFAVGSTIRDCLIEGVEETVGLVGGVPLTAAEGGGGLVSSTGVGG